MADSEVPYADIDGSIRPLVRVLNAFPGLETIGTCGGHEDPRDYQAGPGLWWVIFGLDRSVDAWLSLEFLAWAVTRNLGAGGGVTLEADAPPPYLNGPGTVLRFVLERHHTDNDRQDAEAFARQLGELMDERYIDAQLTDEMTDDSNGFLSPAQREAALIGPTGADGDGHHPTIDVRLGDDKVRVDAELAAVVVEAYRAGIDTISCCQDAGECLLELRRQLSHIDVDGRRHDGRAYLDFAFRRDLVDFHDAVARGGQRDQLYERMVHWAAPGAWLRTIGLEDLGDSDTDIPSGEPTFRPTVYKVEFPRADIPAILERLARYNNGGHVEHGDATWESVAISDATAAE